MILKYQREEKADMDILELNDMITKEKFIEIINLYREHSNKLDISCNVFPMLFESWMIDYFWKCHSELVKSYFNKIGVELIEDYLCENLYDENNQLITDINKIWNIVKDYRI